MVANRIKAALQEVAEVDGQYFAVGAKQLWDERSLARREVLVEELRELCETDPQVAVESHSLFVAMLERTAKIEAQLRQERSEIVQALQHAETSLKQLGAFGDRISADATLVNRLV